MNYIVTNHVQERFVERFCHKFKHELRTTHPARIIQSLLQEAQPDASIFNTKKGLKIMEKYADQRTTFMRNGHIVFVMSGTGNTIKAVTCYEW